MQGMHNKTQSRLLRLPLAAGCGLLLAGVAHAAPSAMAPAPTGKADAVLTQTLAAKKSSGWTAVILKTRDAITPTQQAQLQALGWTCRATCR